MVLSAVDCGHRPANPCVCCNVGVYAQGGETTGSNGAIWRVVDEGVFVPVRTQVLHMVVPKRFTAFNTLITSS